jgi:DNA invertase Pin-like site-specific DNA recombinase
VLELQALRVDSEDIYIDRGLGLRAQNRPELQMVLQILHHGDTLVCASMIRLARSHNDLADVVGRLADLGVSVELAGEVLGDMSTAEVLQLSAEFEVELVKEAMAALQRGTSDRKGGARGSPDADSRSAGMAAGSV